MAVSNERFSRKSCWSSYKVLFSGFAAVNYSPIRRVLKLLYSSHQLEKDALVS